MTYCKSCGARLDDDCKFCGECGAPVKVEEPASQEETKKEPVTETAEQVYTPGTPNAKPEDIYRPAQPNANAGAKPEQAGNSKGLAIASLICGIISIVTCCMCEPVGIAAIVLGIIGIKKCPQSKGLAVAGLIMGIISIVMAFVIGIIVGINIYSDPEWLREYFYENFDGLGM